MLMNRRIDLGLTSSAEQPAKSSAWKREWRPWPKNGTRSFSPPRNTGWPDPEPILFSIRLNFEIVALQRYGHVDPGQRGRNPSSPRRSFDQNANDEGLSIRPTCWKYEIPIILVKTWWMSTSWMWSTAEQLMKWENTLLRIQQTIEEWLLVQTQWLYLDPIFSSPNIIDQMPNEADLFKVTHHRTIQLLNSKSKSSRVINKFNYDRRWTISGTRWWMHSTPTQRYISTTKVMDFKRCSIVFQVMATAGSEGMLEQLTHSSDLLEQINFGVNAYLDKKRLYFSRYFFFF